MRTVDRLLASTRRLLTAPRPGLSQAASEWISLQAQQLRRYSRPTFCSEGKVVRSDRCEIYVNLEPLPTQTKEANKRIFHDNIEAESKLEDLLPSVFRKRWIAKESEEEKLLNSCSNDRPINIRNVL